MIQLIENDEQRFQPAANAKPMNEENWLLSQNVFRWDEAIECVFEITNSNREQDTHIANIPLIFNYLKHLGADSAGGWNVE